MGKISHHKTPFMSRLWNYITLSIMSRSKTVSPCWNWWEFHGIRGDQIVHINETFRCVIAWFSTKANNTSIVSVYQLIQKQCTSLWTMWYIRNTSNISTPSENVPQRIVTTLKKERSYTESTTGRFAGVSPWSLGNAALIFRRNHHGRFCEGCTETTRNIL